jgi:decaprenylphospho-beta-D-erythro-pentofuranosid-2-ulose 2-reductase
VPQEETAPADAVEVTGGESARKWRRDRGRAKLAAAMTDRLRVVVLGATSGMGRALARKMAERGDRVFAPALDAAEAALGGLDAVVVTAGIFATQDALEESPALAAKLMTADFTNTVLFCEEAKKRLLRRGGGTLCVFSSVAGERGRKPVILYGASKAGLTRYLEGLDHKHHRDGLRVVCVKPGFVKTGMTAGLKPPPFAGEPEDVAERVLRAIDRGAPEVYAPFAWGPIMGVIRRLPRFVMRRIGF